MDKLELLLHPVRMRVVLAVANRVLTTQQLAELLPDVTQTTLYRQINILLEGGILTVVRESKVRGTMERELALVEGAGRIDLETSTSLSPQQQDELFTTFIATLLADFRRAQSQPLEGVPSAFYRRQRLYLTLESIQQLNQQFDALLAPYKDSRPHTTGTQVQPWWFTGIIMPDAELSRPDEKQPDEEKSI